MMKHWTSKLAPLVSGACVIASLAVPMAQGVAARTVWDGVYSAVQAARLMRSTLILSAFFMACARS